MKILTVQGLIPDQSFNLPRTVQSCGEARISCIHRDIGVFGVLNEGIFRRMFWGI